MQKHIQDPEFGSITITFRRNSRNLRLSVTYDSKIQISAPTQTGVKYIFSFLESRRQWIRDTLQKIHKKSTGKTIFTPETKFSTRDHTLVLAKSARKDAAVEVRNGRIKVVIPETTEWEEQEIQTIVKKAITETLRVEAHKYLPRKLNELTQKHGFTVKGLQIKDLKSRWGSCTNEFKINLNLNLMLLPDHLIEHVLLHELCHTKVMNHGSEFYALLKQLNPKYAEHDKEIKKFNPKIF